MQEQAKVRDFAQKVTYENKDKSFTIVPPASITSVAVVASPVSSANSVNPAISKMQFEKGNAVRPPSSSSDVVPELDFAQITKQFAKPRTLYIESSLQNG